MAAHRAPYADQRAQQRRFAGAGRPDDAEPLTGLQHEADVADGDPAVGRRRNADGLDRERPRRILQLHRCCLCRDHLQQPVEAVPALPRRDEALPVRDRQIDRRQRPRAQDRAGNDDARGGLLVDHQIRADAEHRRLQHHAQHLGDGAEPAGDVAGAPVAVEIAIIGAGPAPGQPPGHAHRDDHLGVAPAAGGDVAALRRQPLRVPRRPPRQHLGEHGEPHQDQRADRGGGADQRMEGKADRQIERQPRQVEQRARPHAGQEGANIIEVAQRLQALALAALQQRQPHHGLKHPRAERLVERGADPHQDATAQQVEHALRDVQASGQHDQGNQRRHAPARQHAIIDFEHEERAGQIQDVDHEAHHADAKEGAAARPQGVA